MRRINTSSANAPELVRETTNYAYVSPDDAARAGVADGDAREVESEHGRIRIPVRVTRRDDAAHDRDPAVLGPREGRRPVARARSTRA